MSLRALRRSSRLMAVVLLLAAARLPHFAVDDLACLPGPVSGYGEHDESQHALQASTPDEQDHCAICHWTRSLRSPRTSVPATAAAATAPTPVLRPPASDVRAAVLDQLPARAPPFPV